MVCLFSGCSCLVIECLLLCVVVANVLFVATCALRVVSRWLALFATCCALRGLPILSDLANVTVVECFRCGLFVVCLMLVVRCVMLVVDCWLLFACC